MAKASWFGAKGECSGACFQDVGLGVPLLQITNSLKSGWNGHYGEFFWFLAMPYERKLTWDGCRM